MICCHRLANHPLPDEELLQTYLILNPTYCLDVLYNRHANYVFRTCLKRAGDAQKAKDLTQDIFLKVAEKLPTFQFRSSFVTWLYAITANYCADQVGKASRLLTHPLNLSDNCLIAEADSSPLDELLGRLEQAMASLSAADQLMLSMKYKQGQSLVQIAQAHNLSINAVKMRLLRGRQKLLILCAR